MSLTVGTRLQHYEIVGALGTGGMGEVYRASDTKLRREVAIKILPAPFANDRSRLARFEREAHALASLNHPNIAAIHGLEHVDGVHFLVLELVDGPTLAEHLASKRLNVSDALRIATQIAEAIEAAHDKGIVHRDLKPANVKLGADGRVKVLDFGLAKAMGEPDLPDAVNSPTFSDGETRAGVVLGTAGYMSPEQASGRPVDKRTDVWSFGVLLYEMLSGRRAFDGRTVSHTLVHVMEQETDWSALPPLPAGLQDMLERCLQKEPAQRLRDIGDVRLLLQSAIAKPVATQSGPGPSSRRRWLTWGVGTGAALALITSVVLGFAYLRRSAPAPEPIRFEFAQPGSTTLTSWINVSPDGRKVAFIATGADAQTRIWVRTLDTLEAQPLEGTRGATGKVIWSPDSRSMAFASEGTLKRIDAFGGVARTIASNVNTTLFTGGFWTNDDRIVFGQFDGPIVQVAAAGGVPAALTRLDRSRKEVVHGAPSLMPDGRQFIYTVGGEEGGVYLGTLDSRPENQGAKRLLSGAPGTQFVASPDPRIGYLLHVQFNSGDNLSGPLMAARFDTRSHEVGESAHIADGVPLMGFSASDNGVLVYRAGTMGSLFRGAIPGAPGQLTWFDRQGRVLGTAGDPDFFTFGVKLSPDSTRLALTRPDTKGNFDIWIYEFARGALTRLTSDPAPDVAPVWSPDGARITFMSYRADDKGGRLYEKAANNAGSEQPLFIVGERAAPNDWSRDERFLAFYDGGPAAGDIKLYVAGPPDARKVVPLLNSQFVERGGSFSPDGRWIAYTSNETGAYQIYIRGFDASTATANGGQSIVSTGAGGTGAKWSRDGREIFYQAPDGTIMSVDVTTTPTFKAATPRALFKTAVTPFWDVTPDAQRFLIPVPQEESSPAPFKVVLNWTSTLKN